MTIRIARLVSSALSVETIGERRLSLPLPGAKEPAPSAEDRMHLPTRMPRAARRRTELGHALLMTCDTLASADAGSAVTILETDDGMTPARGRPRS